MQRLSHGVGGRCRRCRRAKSAPAWLDHGRSRRWRARNAGADRSCLVRLVSRRCGRTALRWLPSRGRAWWQSARSGFHERQGQGARSSVPTLSRGHLMTPARKTFLWLAAVIVAVLAGAVLALVRTFPHSPPALPPELVPPSWTEYRTSAGHVQHVGKGTIVCTDCHTQTSGGFQKPDVAVCTHCHTKESGQTHHGGSKKTDCLVCHTFIPGQVVPTCIGCHAEAQALVAAVTTHRTIDCQSCHQTHETPAVTSKPCAECHTEKSLSHANHEKSQDCLDCHKPHAPAMAARDTCSSCHATPRGPKPAGHDSCLTCHKPHDFTATGARTCQGCHGAKPTLLASLVTEGPMPHAQCTGCHTPHAPGAAANSCRQCHSEVHVDHRGKDECIACHVPHGTDTTTKASACTSCHEHIGATDRDTHAKGLVCTNCHVPHSFPTPASKMTLCTGCHASEISLVAQNRGHADCGSCHGRSAHRPSPAPACSTCHTKEAATATAGHQKCATCHEPHAGTLLPQATTCKSCHQNKSQVLHANLPAGCETCHRAHGPEGIAAAPSCVSCHQPKSLPALHTAPAHAKCTQCHTAHNPPSSDRATCTSSCHVDRQNHQPQAAVCTGCHVFRR